MMKICDFVNVGCVRRKIFSKIFENEFLGLLEVSVIGAQFFIVFFLISPFLFWCCLLTDNIIIRALGLLYLIRIVAQKDIGHRGDNSLGYKWMRELITFDAARNYFPVDLIKTADLPPNRNYLFAVFPHGFLSFGVMFNFASNSSKFWKLYPGVRAKILTLNALFFFPIMREWIIGFGAGAPSSKCIQKLLAASNDPKDPSNSDGYTSNAAILVVGGVREVFYARPGEYRIVAKSRKGYVKQAIIAGSSLVPVFSFGEVDLYDQPPNPVGSKRRAFQEFTRRWLGLPFLTFSGRFMFIPKQKPLNTVVGAPIHCEKIENPTEEDINKVHEIFLKQLIDLFETHKQKFVPDHENVQLIFD